MKAEFVQSGTLNSEVRAIRAEVFVNEQGYRNEFDEIDARAVHLLLRVDGEAAGCCRFFPDEEPGVWVLGRVAVRKPLRRRGYAARIVLEAVSRMKALGASRINLGAQRYATGLYEKCGFVPSGPVYLDEGNPHVPMSKRL